MDMDFYTAVDDLLPEDTTGAGMLGTLEFNSACFYRYANVDLRQLSDNLDDHDLALRTVEAFLRAFIHAVPTGKQNSTAAQNPPSFVMTVVRNKGLWSLANAFLKPVRADENGDLVANSIKALDTHWSQLSAMYGEDGIVGKWWAALDGESIVNLKSARADGVEDLIGRTISAIAGQVGSRSG
jgi:CRISPR system Cascade subunit CasC